MTNQEGSGPGPGRGRGGRAGVVLAGAVAVLVVLAVVAAVLASTRPGPELPQGSPEATVGDYVRLVHDGDLEGAAALLDPAGNCTVDDLEQGYVQRDVRMVLRDSQIMGNRAVVEIGVVYGGPFGGDSYESEERFELVRDGDQWVVGGEPWPMYGCTDAPMEG